MLSALSRIHDLKKKIIKIIKNNNNHNSCFYFKRFKSKSQDHCHRTLYSSCVVRNVARNGDWCSDQSLQQCSLPTWSEEQLSRWLNYRHCEWNLSKLLILLWFVWFPAKIRPLLQMIDLSGVSVSLWPVWFPLLWLVSPGLHQGMYPPPSLTQARCSLLVVSCSWCLFACCSAVPLLLVVQPASVCAPAWSWLYLSLGLCWINLIAVSLVLRLSPACLLVPQQLKTAP